jgi:RNA ligase (TIGR02306 family)
MSSLIVEAVKIKNIEPIAGADKIVLATVKGWNCVIQKDSYAVGDLVVFIPPDSILPEAMIEKHGLTYMKNGDRIRTVKLRGVISQGLILPLPSGRFKEGDDLSKVLGITKWQPPEPKYSTGSGNQVSKKKLNPLFDKYTEIENIKNYTDVFVEGDDVVITEKLHGYNARYRNLEISNGQGLGILERLSNWYQKYILKQTHQFVYGSHNVQITSFSNKSNFYGEDLWGSMAKKYNLKDIPKGVIVYGEIVGEGVQDLTYGVKERELFVFDVKMEGKYLTWGEVKDFCDAYGLQIVPEIYFGRYYDGILDVYTQGKSVICPTQMREGIVIKMYDEGNDRKIGRKILKSVSGEYLARKNGSEFK